MLSRRQMLAGCATAFFGFLAVSASNISFAKDHDHGHGHDDDDDDDDHGHGHGNGHGRGHDDDDRFDDRDRVVFREWYHDRRDHDDLPPGLRDRDRLPPGLEKRLRVGYVMDADLRRRIYACPEDLDRRLPPPPPRCRYVMVGGHICLIGADYHVFDVIHFELNF